MLELVFGQSAKRDAQHFAIEPVLAVEMVVDRRLIHLSLGDNGADAGAVVAALGEQPLRRPHDALARDFGWSRHLPHRCHFFKPSFEFLICVCGAQCKQCNRFFHILGAFAVAPDYYFRLGDMPKVTDTQELMPKGNSKSDAELFAALDATVAWAKSQGGDSNRLGIMGFCRGGRNVWHYSAHNPNLKAGVAFYGPLVDKNDAATKSSIDLAPEGKGPVLGLYG